MVGLELYWVNVVFSSECKRQFSGMIVENNLNIEALELASLTTTKIEKSNLVLIAS